MANDSKYNISGGQQGAVGDNATAHDFTQQQITQQQPVDLKVLAEQLGQVVAAAKTQATEPEHQLAIGSIEAAKAAAEKGDESKALSFLKTAGKWVLGIADDIGAKIAVEVIKKQIGL